MLLSRFVFVIDRITVIIYRHVSPIKRKRITSSFGKTTQVLGSRTLLSLSLSLPGKTMDSDRYRFNNESLKTELTEERKGGKRDRKGDVEFNWINGLRSSVSRIQTARGELQLLQWTRSIYSMYISHSTATFESVRSLFLFPFIE